MECQSAGWRISEWMLLTRSVWGGATFYLVPLHDFQNFLHSNNFGFLVVVSNQMLSPSFDFQHLLKLCPLLRCILNLTSPAVPMHSGPPEICGGWGRPSVGNEGSGKTFPKEVPIQLAPSSSDLDNRSASGPPFFAVSQCSFILAEHFLMSP